MTLLPIILSGGVGTRLWPLSREFYPKQFLYLFNQKSLFQETVCRLNRIDEILNPIIVCHQEHRFLIAEQLKEIGAHTSAILLEPVSRNTAPAITVAALQALAEFDDPVLLILPADHLITDGDAFRKIIKKSLRYAEENKLITFGIKPTEPNTGYGYLKKGSKLGVEEIYRLDKFVEKPDAEKARLYAENSDYYWNSGILMCKASRILQEIAHYQPEIFDAGSRAFSNRLIETDFMTLDRTAFSSSPCNSIDYAVMEKVSDVVMMPMDVGWSDVGSWAAMYNISPKDDQGNVTFGNVFVKESTNSYLRTTSSRLLAVIGLDDIVVVEQEDAILVCRKDKCQEVKVPPRHHEE